MLRNHSEAATEKARKLRRAMTKPERLLWAAMRSRKFGWKVRRQHPIGPFVCDFYIDEANVDLEIDGKWHESNKNRDRARDKYISKCGVIIIRVSAAAVLRDPHEVAHSISMSIKERLASSPYNR